MIEEIGKLLSRSELARSCADQGFAPVTRTIDMSQVPPALHVLQPYAEIWGAEIIDERYEVIVATPTELRAHVISVVLCGELSLPLIAWLGGDAAAELCHDEGYIALSDLSRCAELMEVLRRQPVRGA